MNQEKYTAFQGDKRFAKGSLKDVVLSAKQSVPENEWHTVLFFNDASGRTMDFALNGTEEELLKRLSIFAPEQKQEAPKGPGRPKLGVVSREISLLPRHWEWLATQSGGASSTLRKLVDAEQKKSSAKDQIKQAQTRAYNFMSAIAGDLPQYEEAIRALFAHDQDAFKKQMAKWPKDIRTHAVQLAKGAFESK
ncbi:DUF2239 family protein [bacterium]|nr:DUF2239 family protein [bacterium]